MNDKINAQIETNLIQFKQQQLRYKANQKNQLFHMEEQWFHQIIVTTIFFFLNSFLVGEAIWPYHNISQASNLQLVFSLVIGIIPFSAFSLKFYLDLKRIENHYYDDFHLEVAYPNLTTKQYLDYYYEKEPDLTPSQRDDLKGTLNAIFYLLKLI